MKRISTLLVVIVLLLSVFAVAAGATSPAMDIITFEDGKTDGEMIVFEQGGALAVEEYEGCLSVVLPDIHSGFVTTEAYEDFTIQFDVGGVGSGSAIAGISFGLESPDSVAMADGHMLQINMDTVQLFDYNNPDAPKRYIINESVRPPCVGLDTYWPLSPDEWLMDTYDDEGEFTFGYKRNTYKLVKEGSTIRLYRKNNIMGESGQAKIFELVNCGWVDVQEDAGYVRISFINSDEFLIDNVCFSPEPYADFPVMKNETEEPVAPTEKPTTAPTEKPTTAPTEAPTTAPTEEPTTAPTEEPTTAPTEEPTEEPTTAPTEEPTTAPTEEPTYATRPTTEPEETQPTTPNTQKPDQNDGNDGLIWVLVGGGAALLIVIVAIVVALKVAKRRN